MSVIKRFPTLSIYMQNHVKYIFNLLHISYFYFGFILQDVEDWFCYNKLTFVSHVTT